MGEAAVSLEGVLEWDRLEMSVRVILDLAGTGIRLPAGRGRAEALLADAFPALIEPALLGVQVDSSSTIEDMIHRGELSLQDLDAFSALSRRVPPVLTPDLGSLWARYTLNLAGLGSAFIRHTRPRTAVPPLIPVPAREYTGIIIIADERLPVHGQSTAARLEPCLFPKVWDSDMNLVFDRNMIDPAVGKERGLVRYVSRDRITRATPTALDEDLEALVGDDPLRIIARGIFGLVPTDPIIHREDALIIQANESNLGLLRAGRVVLVVDRGLLRRDIP
jgi:hypothetical protein